MPNKEISEYQKEQERIENEERYLKTQTYGVVSILVLAIFYTMYFAAELLLPLILAWIFYVLLNPSVNFLKKRVYIPPYIGSALIILVALIIVGFIVYSLSAQAKAWLDNAPKIMARFNEKIAQFTFFLRRPLEILSKIGQDINATISAPGPKTVVAPAVSAFSLPTIMGFFITNSYSFLVGFGIFLIFLYFLLATEDFFLSKIVEVMVTLQQKKEAIIASGEIASQIQYYLFIRTLINIVVAVVVSLMLYLFGIPNPILWGVMAGFLEFIPFIGACISLIIITIVSIVTFDNPWYIFSIPLTFFVFINIEGNIVAPYIFGKSMILNTIAVILSLFLFGWIWGIVGMFLAVPLIMILKIILNNTYPDSFLNKLLS